MFYQRHRSKMKMVNEKETIFINQFGVRFRRCEVSDCIYCVDKFEVSTGGVMSNKKGTPFFKGNVCNCSPEDPISLKVAAKVRCYPIEDRMKSDYSNLEFISNLKNR